VAADGGVGGQRTDGDVIGSDFDALKLGQFPDADEAPVRKFSSLEENHQVRATGKGFPDAVFAGQAVEHGGKIARSLHFVGRKVAPHARDSVWRQASSTDSKILM
jgi:hypothetical protein